MPTTKSSVPFPLRPAQCSRMETTWHSPEPEKWGRQRSRNSPRPPAVHIIPKHVLSVPLYQSRVQRCPSYVCPVPSLASMAACPSKNLRKMCLLSLFPLSMHVKKQCYLAVPVPCLLAFLNKNTTSLFTTFPHPASRVSRLSAKPWGSVVFLLFLCF